jgi:hypothetical protein
MAGLNFRRLSSGTRMHTCKQSIIKQERKKMSFRQAVRDGFLGRAFAMIASANAVSATIESGRRPKHRDLRELGIDPSMFGKINH